MSNELSPELAAALLELRAAAWGMVETASNSNFKHAKRRYASARDKVVSVVYHCYKEVGDDKLRAIASNPPSESDTP